MDRKTLSRLLIGFLLCFSISILSAQPPQFQRQLNTMTFNNQVRMNNQMMQMMNMRGVTGTGGEFNFVVVMRDSTRLNVASALYTDSATHKRFIIFTDKKYSKKDTNRYKKIYPSQTARLIRKVSWPGDFSDPVCQGIPNDTCWMFKVITGPIGAYCYFSRVDLPGRDPEPFQVAGIQLNNGAIVEFSDSNLKQMIASDSTAMEYFQKKKYIKALKRFNKDSEKINK